jgi:hypothetical protein
MRDVSISWSVRNSETHSQEISFPSVELVELERVGSGCVICSNGWSCLVGMKLALVGYMPTIRQHSLPYRLRTQKDAVSSQYVERCCFLSVFAVSHHGHGHDIKQHRVRPSSIIDINIMLK